VVSPQATSAEPKKGSRQADFLKVAAELFAQRGYGGTSIDDLGARLGVSGPAVYWHFASKEALLTQMLTDISERLLAGGNRCVAEAADGHEALRNLVGWQVEFALEHPELITVHARDLAHVPNPARRRIRRAQRLYVERWVEALGGVAPEVPSAVRRSATHAAIGLINSTPYLGEVVDRPAMAELLTHMALAALYRALDRPVPAGD
jgi:AcrR family transcriptional regulator